MAAEFEVLYTFVGLVALMSALKVCRSRDPNSESAIPSHVSVPRLCGPRGCCVLM